jgi:hypothetical protein
LPPFFETAEPLNGFDSDVTDASDIIALIANSPDNGHKK